MLLLYIRRACESRARNSGLDTPSELQSYHIRNGLKDYKVGTLGS